MLTRRQALTEAEMIAAVLERSEVRTVRNGGPDLGVDDETLVGEGSYETCKNACTSPCKSLAQSRNVGSNDPMARSGQGGVRGLEGQIWVLMLPK